jgi:uncharacterized protein YndB with AHSA1/START domain
MEEKSKLVITRVFDAPRELVFKAWSQAGRLAQWWGPKGCKIEVSSLEFRAGGIFHYCMSMPDGGEMWGKFIYRQIIEPEKIVFVSSFSDREGNITRSPFSPSWPLEVLNNLTLTEKDGKTTLTLSGGPIGATQEEIKTFASFVGSMQQGFGGTFDQLAEYLAKVQSGNH